jgi:hypothetical protein
VSRLVTSITEAAKRRIASRNECEDCPVEEGAIAEDMLVSPDVSASSGLAFVLSRYASTVPAFKV